MQPQQASSDSPLRKTSDPEKKPYEPPAWESETVFETQALACSRATVAGGGKVRCLFNRTT
ncbi:MAG: hypothetical protein HZA23_04360 [Nitrospirae bacterium]|nr:hypothetical protein [Nitrospirota bacterium]